MFTEFNRIFSLEVDLKNLEVTYNSKALYTNVDLNTSTMMIKMSLDQNALDLTGKTVNAFIKTGIDKNITMQRCEILEATEGIIGLDFKSSALKAGTNTFFLEIKSENEEIINSPLITYKVVELFDTYSSIEGDNNVSILTELITEVDIAKGSVEVLKNEIAEQERQREEAEASRKNNESSRIQAETNRTNSESTRVTNENNRKQAESTRESNETKRVNAENLRESAENTRKQEETKRSQNESLRVESEKERVLSYEEIKNNNAIFKEQMNTDFGNAKTDYFGEEHPNVVERLNSDFDNLHQRMNNSSLLPYEGTSIKADNSYYGLTKDMVIKGRSLKNLWNGLKSFTCSTSTQIRGYKTDMLKQSTTYTFITTISNSKYDFSIGSIYSIGYSDGHTDYFATPDGLTNGVKVWKIVTKADKKPTYIGIGIHGNNSSSSNATFDNTVILEGDYTNTPLSELPYIEGIQSVGENEITEDGRYKISGKSCGKNLFDIRKWENIIYSDGKKVENVDIVNGLVEIKQRGEDTYIKTGATGSNVCSIDERKYLIRVEPNTTYTLSMEVEGTSERTNYIQEYDKDYNKIAMYVYGSSTNDSKTFTTKNNTYYVGFRIGIRSTTSATLIYSKIQFKEEDSKTDYEPYQESTYEYVLSEPLRSLPNGVCDIIEGDKVIRRVGKVVLDGIATNDYRIGAQPERNQKRTQTYLFRLVKNDIKIVEEKSNNILSDKLIGENAYNKDNECCIVANNANSIWFSIDRSKLVDESVSTLQDYLKTNPLTFYYELTEPVVTELDETLQLKTFDGKTHVISDNYLMSITSAKIPSNVQAVVSSLITENKELTEEVSTLSVENEELKQTNEIQDELIDINMCATDEMYVLLEPLLAQSISTMSLEREVSKMVDLYVAMIQRGLKTIEQVPERYREQVREVLEQLEK